MKRLFQAFCHDVVVRGGYCPDKSDDVWMAVGIQNTDLCLETELVLILREGFDGDLKIEVERWGVGEIYSKYEIGFRDI